MTDAPGAQYGRLRLRLQTPADVAHARHAVRTALHTWGLTSATDDSVIVVSELATNALTAGGTAVLTVYQQLTGVLVMVEDHSPTDPYTHPRAAPDDDETGRGLTLVATLATQHGWKRQTHSKTVWAAISV